jgi:hypothetical protein
LCRSYDPDCRLPIGVLFIPDKIFSNPVIHADIAATADEQNQQHDELVGGKLNASIQDDELRIA